MKPRKAAVLFIFITVTLDMLALGLIAPVLPKLVLNFLGGDAPSAAIWLARFSRSSGYDTTRHDQFAAALRQHGSSPCSGCCGKTGLLMSPTTKAFAAANSINKSWKSQLVDCHFGTGHFMIKTARSPDSKEEAPNA